MASVRIGQPIGQMIRGQINCSVGSGLEHESVGKVVGDGQVKEYTGFIAVHAFRSVLHQSLDPEY